MQDLKVVKAFVAFYFLTSGAMMKKIFMAFFVLSLFLSFSQAFAAHPLITDDTGTQGQGKFQLEINGEFSSDRETAAGVITKEKDGELAATLSYGISDSVDLVLGPPFQWFKVKENGLVAEDESGFSDLSLELKWRFFDKEGLSLALKPGVTIPTGDEDRGLGTGRATYSLFFITTKEADPWTFHLNLGYVRNDNKTDERKNLWHASLAATVEIAKDLQAVANIGIESNTEKETGNHPVFLLGGLIYSLSESFDLDCGIKGGLTDPETDCSVLAGMTWRI